MTREEICKRYYRSHTEQHKAGVYKWRATNPEKVKAITKRSRQKNMPRALATNRAYARRCRLAALQLYGNRCACCGEATEQFLTFDHINNNGKSDRQSAVGLYRRLLREQPKDIQILCWNCNCAKGKYGICPHKSGMSVVD